MKINYSLVSIVLILSLPISPYADEICSIDGDYCVDSGENHYCAPLPSVKECQTILDESMIDYEKWAKRKHTGNTSKDLKIDEKYFNKISKILWTGKPKKKFLFWFKQEACYCMEDEGKWKYSMSQKTKNIIDKLRK